MIRSFGFEREGLLLPPIVITHQFMAIPSMAIDTGARVTMITPALASELGINLAGLKPTVQIVGVVGSARAIEVTLARISLLGIPVENVKALCHPLPPRLGLDGILGLNFLQHFNLAINHDTLTVTVERCAG
jgi:clan AA aspartic protease (TIGR02281 family)